MFQNFLDPSSQRQGYKIIFFLYLCFLRHHCGVNAMDLYHTLWAMSFLLWDCLCTWWLNVLLFSDGTGYVDDGREIFDDDLDDEPPTGQLINN